MDLEFQSKLQRVMDNEAEEVQVPSGKVFKVKRLTNYLAIRIGKLVTKGQLACDSTEENEFQKMAENMDANRQLAPKACSLAILHNPIKIWLFHWMYWRYLSAHYTQEDFGAILDFVNGEKEMHDFFANVASLRRNNTVATMVATKALTTMTTKAEQESDQNPT